VPSMAGTVLRNNFEIRNRNKLAWSYLHVPADHALFICVTSGLVMGLHVLYRLCYSLLRACQPARVNLVKIDPSYIF
jgi:hypothetical protein